MIIESKQNSRITEFYAAMGGRAAEFRRPAVKDVT